jgi:DNA-binding PadR family transcriptional regulator
MSNDLLPTEDGLWYPALQRLLQEELVKTEWGSSRGNRRLRICKRTPAGGKDLEREMSSFKQMLRGSKGVLARGEL